MTVFNLISDVMQADGGVTDFAKMISEIVSSCIKCPARCSCRIKNNPLHFGGLCYEEIENYLNSELKCVPEIPKQDCVLDDFDDNETSISYTGYDWQLKPLLKSPNKYVVQMSSDKNTKN